MAFQVDCRKEPDREILRVIREETAAAGRKALLTNEELPERIHRARAACKRIRSALRLIRGPCRELYARENRWFRDSGRRLAPLRDVDVMLSQLGEFSGRPGPRQRTGPFPPALIDALLVRLEAKRQEGPDADRELARFVSRMHAAERRLRPARLEPVRFAAMVDGFEATYRRARRAIPRSATANGRTFHEWRKKTKFFSNQVRLLRAFRPKVMKALWREFAELGELLGAEHDLSLLRAFLLRMNEPGIDRLTVVNGCRLIQQRRDEHRREALVLGRRLFSARPRDLARRLLRRGKGARGSPT